MEIYKNEYLSFVNGFKTATASANIKKDGKKDIGIIYSDQPCISAGVFTTNKIRSKTIDICRENIKNDIKAIVINSGNANACTGEDGYKDAINMVKEVSKHLNVKENEILISSTGIIGEKLPMDKIIPGIKKASENLEVSDGKGIIEAIMTTDTVEKQIAVKIKMSDNKEVKIAGIAKGSGMINPNMATMLAYIVSDINISKTILQDIMDDVTNKTFNMIAVDNDTSTNDSFIFLGNGQANNKKINNKSSNDYKIFYDAFYFITSYLAKEIARDGEGATKLMEINVIGAEKEENARNIAKKIIKSYLVKTAIFGEDANWGRIIAAIGNADANICENLIDIKIGGILVCEKGCGIKIDNKIIKKVLEKDEIIIEINMNMGNSTGSSWGCDLSYDYIKINADYRT